jgi:hypothetical protein
LAPQAPTNSWRCGIEELIAAVDHAHHGWTAADDIGERGQAGMNKPIGVLVAGDRCHDDAVDTSSCPCSAAVVVSSYVIEGNRRLNLRQI